MGDRLATRRSARTLAASPIKAALLRVHICPRSLCWWCGQGVPKRIAHGPGRESRERGSSSFGMSLPIGSVRMRRSHGDCGAPHPRGRAPSSNRALHRPRPVCSSGDIDSDSEARSRFAIIVVGTGC